MSSTALYADYVLPAASSYEKCDVTDWYTPLSPFAHVTNAAVAPLGEAKPEWEIFALLAKNIQERARQRGILTFTGRDGKRKRLDGVYDRMTFGRRLTESDHERVTETIVGQSTNLEKMSWPEFKRRGFAIHGARLPSGQLRARHRPEARRDDHSPYLAHRKEDPLAYPHETDPVLHRPSPLPRAWGGDAHPQGPSQGRRRLSLDHDRWPQCHSIHALLRDNPHAELERGEPVILCRGRQRAGDSFEDGEGPQ
jgi:anaerobic selenocysteine-containing dehydrogenase